MENIKSFKGIAFKSIAEAFTKAFADYEVQISEAELQNMLVRRGFIPELSFAAFHNNQIISFTLNGIGSFNGIKTAYDTGTGTLQAFRGRGWATQIFKHSVPHLKAAGIQQYLLEVLQHNHKAVSVYEKIGFRISREFDYYIAPGSCVHSIESSSSEDGQMRNISLEQIKNAYRFMDFTPTWQNGLQAISRDPHRFLLLGYFLCSKLVGYCILEPSTGDIAQLAVDQQHRRKGIGSLLLKEALKLNHKENFKIINIDSSCSSMIAFLQARKIISSGKQFEMLLEL